MKNCNSYTYSTCFTAYFLIFSSDNNIYFFVNFCIMNIFRLFFSVSLLSHLAFFQLVYAVPSAEPRVKLINLEEELAKAEKGDDVESQFLVGDMHLQGLGFEQNIKKGLDLVMKAAHKGHLGAKFKVGFYMRKKALNQKTKKTRDKLLTRSLDFFYSASQLEDPRAYHILGATLLDLNRIEEGLPWLELAARHAYAPAMFDLFTFYALEPSYQDEAKATQYLINAAILGFGMAELKYAELLFEVDKIDEAKRWADKAANKDMPQAWLLLSVIYNQKDDVNNALFWAKRAANAGVVKAMHFTATLLRSEKMLASLNTISKANAYKQHSANLYEIAAAKGFVPSQISIANLYFNGDVGLEKNRERTWYWLQVAMKSKSKLAKLAKKNFEELQQIDNKEKESDRKFNIIRPDLGDCQRKFLFH